MPLEFRQGFCHQKSKIPGLRRCSRDPAFGGFGTVSACVIETDGRTQDDSI